MILFRAPCQATGLWAREVLQKPVPFNRAALVTLVLSAFRPHGMFFRSNCRVHHDQFLDKGCQAPLKKREDITPFFRRRGTMVKRPNAELCRVGFSRALKRSSSICLDTQLGRKYALAIEFGRD